MNTKKNWKLKIGNFLFRFRSFTPLPLIIIVLFVFKPKDLGKYNLFISIAGFTVTLLGQLIRIGAVGFSRSGTSGREKYLRADELNVTGLYSLARNPLYLGNFLIYLGLFIVFSNIMALGLFIFFLWVQYYFIILAEEDYLLKKYDSEYSRYAENVPRVIPHFKTYIKPALNFNWKKVIVKENDSVFNQLMMFILILVFKELKFSGRVDQGIIYILVSAILIGLYIGIKVYKKRNSG